MQIKKTIESWGTLYPYYYVPKYPFRIVENGPRNDVIVMYWLWVHVEQFIKMSLPSWYTALGSANQHHAPSLANTSFCKAECELFREKKGKVPFDKKLKMSSVIWAINKVPISSLQGILKESMLWQSLDKTLFWNFSCVPDAIIVWENIQTFVHFTLATFKKLLLWLFLSDLLFFMKY